MNNPLSQSHNPRIILLHPSPVHQIQDLGHRNGVHLNECKKMGVLRLFFCSDFLLQSGPVLYQL